MLSLPAPTASARFGHMLTPRWMHAPRCFVGIDIGVQQVRVAGLGATRGDRRLSWVAASEFALPIDPSDAPPADWVDQVASLLIDRLPRCIDGESNLAMIALPLPWIHYETITADQLAASRQQCDAMFAASLFQSSAHVCHWPLVPQCDQQMLLATADAAAVRVAESVAAVGYDVAGILPHGAALAEAARPLTSIDGLCGVLLEPSGGLVSMFDGNQCGLCRCLAPQQEMIAQFGPDSDVLDLQPWLEEVAEEINATCRYWQRLGGNPPEDAPVLIGGAVAAVPEVDAMLAKYLDRPVAKWSYTGARRPVSEQLAPAESAADQDPCRAVSLSLAYAAARPRAGARR